ncbi:hypothetical protein KEM55_003480, partial [Ascosphaera atra]
MDSQDQQGLMRGCDAPSYLDYTAVPGYFAQDDPSTDADTFDFTKSFGLIEQAYDTDEDLPGDPKNYTQWERFAFKLKNLNDNAPSRIQYKLIFAGRHGEGYHNAGEQKYGTTLWDCYWALLDGDADGTWKDALLTRKGIGQAKNVHNVWIEEMRKNIPLPQVHIVSPMRRCIQTANYTFEGLDLPKERKFLPVIKELLRETIGLHTCDMRSPKSTIEKFAPDNYTIEPGFSEQDPFWKSNEQESPTARNARLLAFLDEIFDARLGKRVDYYPLLTPHAAEYVSLTAHSGAITSILAVTKHRDFTMETGSVIPILLKIERKDG